MYTTFLVVLGMLCACVEQNNLPESQLKMGESILTSSGKKYGKSAESEKVISKPAEVNEGRSEKALQKAVKVKEVRYSIEAMSGLSFVERKGEKPETADKEQLEKETVVFLELESDFKNILEPQRIQLSKDKAVQYLMSGIAANVTAIQGEDEHHPDGVLLDRSLKGTNKLRVILFFSALDHSREFRFNYQDELFGAGEIKLSRP